MSGRRTYSWTPSAAIALVALVFGACGGEERGAQSSAPAVPEVTGEPITRTTELGPITATVTLVPAEVTLGDPLQLTLEVVAKPGVEVEMPQGGDALTGRFDITHEIPRAGTDADGNQVLTRRYILQAPMSGRQRIPPLRIEFVDNRPGQPDPDAASDEPEVKELLTEELSVVVKSMLPEDVQASLRDAPGELPVTEGEPLWRDPAFLLLIAGALVAIAVALLMWRRGANRRESQASAYEIAMLGLHALEARGLPDPEQAGAWYVDLSAVIRRYLEGRYGVRAPELTTEEFLREARRSGRIELRHRALLSSFLEGCDRVKFAGYQPDDDESREALAAARRFVSESRLQPSGAHEGADTSADEEGAAAA